MLDATPDGVLTIHRLGFTISANVAADRILGHPSDQLVGQSIARFVPEPTTMLRWERPEGNSSTESKTPARNMERLLHDMLELSRIGSTPDDPVRVHPRAVLMWLQSEFKLQLDDENIELAIPEDPSLLLVGRTRLYPLFSNLIGNAIAHMDPNRNPLVPGRIDVKLENVDAG